jgi:hypothetical protein
VEYDVRRKRCILDTAAIIRSVSLELNEMHKNENIANNKEERPALSYNLPQRERQGK